jgi:hypothetical protein
MTIQEAEAELDRVTPIEQELWLLTQASNAAHIAAQERWFEVHKRACELKSFLTVAKQQIEPKP